MANRQKVIQNAEKLVARGRIQAAIDEYRKVLDRHPNDTSTLNRVGDLYARLNRMPKAIELFQQTAESFARQGFFVKAIAIYKKIIRLDPSQIRAYKNLADLYNRQGLTIDSLAQYQVVADYYEKHDDLESAIEVYYNMVDIEPTNPTRRLQVAGLLKRDGRKSQALDQFYEIASLMLEHARGDDALRVFNEALDVDSSDVDFVRKAMVALKDAGFDALSEELLESAAKRNPQVNALRIEALEPVDESADEPEPEAVEEAAAEPEAAQEEEVEGEEEAEEVDVASVEEVTAAADPELEAVESEEDEADAVEVVETADSEDLEFDLAEIDAAAEAEDEGKAKEDVEAEADVEAAASVEVEEDVEAEADAGSLVLELDETEEDGAFQLEEDEALEPASQAEAADVVSLDLDEEEEPESIPPLESVASAADAGASAETVKLLIEAEVLSRYGMDVMAITALEKILKGEPENSEALARLVTLQVKLDRTDEALVGASQLAEIVAEKGEPSSWAPLCEAMAERGFVLEDGRFVGPPLPAEEPEAEVAVEEPVEAQESVVEEPSEPVEAAPVEAAPVEEASIEDLVADVQTLEKQKVQHPTGTQDVLAEVIEEIERDDEGAAAEESADWLDESEEVGDTFVDLATELEEELASVADLDDDFGAAASEQSLEDIVEGFRQGMAETLSEEDYDTHYNLGVAYSEMGLTDEAIGEFQLAAKDPRYLVESSSLLAACFVEKGFVDLAVQAYENGLASPSLEEEQRLGLLYELGTLLVATGEPEAARERFVELYGVNSNYRDVVARLEELKE